MSALIQVNELKEILHQPHMRLLDASYNLPPSAQAIPGALDFDIDDIANPQSPFAHTIPSAEMFSAKLSALGVSNGDLVIIYDRAGMSMAAARAWWMLRLFGHDQVKILNGGLPAWVRAGYPVAEKAVRPVKPGFFQATLRAELLKTLEQVSDNIAHKKFSVIDARDTKRFEAGHIPGSGSVPYLNLLKPDATLKAADQLKSSFQAVPLQGSLVCSCGSGVTACVLALALYELGHPTVAVYDGCWTEWSANAALPQEQGF